MQKNSLKAIQKSSQKTVLLLGAGLMQIPAAQAVKKRNYKLIIADADKKAPALQYADEFWHISLRDIDKLVEKVQESSPKKTIDAVFTSATDFSYAVSCIAKKAGVLGLSPEVAKKVNYKHHMRKVFDKYNIPSPNYITIRLQNKSDLQTQILKNNKKYKNIAAKLGYPIVIKPVDNMGARGVLCVRQENELQNALTSAFLQSPSRSIILEKKLEGPELSIDAFVINKKLYSVGVADRHIYFFPYFIETGHSIPSRLPQKMIDDACKVMERAAKALALDNAVFKGDIIFHRGKAYIGECAARLSGGYMSGWTIPYAYHHFPVEQALDLALGNIKNALNTVSVHNKDAKNNSKNNRGTVVVERAIIPLPGLVQKFCIPPSLQNYGAMPPLNSATKKNTKKLTSVVRLKNIIVTAQKGMKYKLPTNNTQKAGNIIVQGPDHQTCEHYTNKVLSQLYCEVRPNIVCDRFLFSSKKTDIKKYTPWFCYPQFCQFYEKLSPTPVLAQVEKNLRECLKKQQLSIYLSTPIKNQMEKTNEIGGWTNTKISEVIKHAVKQKKIYLVSTEEKSVNNFAMKALLRGGWQGLYYTLQVLQEDKKRLKKFL